MFMLVPVVSHDQKHFALCFDHFDVWGAMVLLTLLVAHLMLMPVPLTSFDQESHAAAHSYHLDIKSLMCHL